MISDRVPKGRFNWDINMVLNVLNACMVIFMQKVVEPENFHEFCEQITYHLRRNADHIINQMKLKERDASQSTDHNTASDT